MERYKTGWEVFRPEIRAKRYDGTVEGDGDAIAAAETGLTRRREADDIQR